jgi:hypothetical protein
VSALEFYIEEMRAAFVQQDRVGQRHLMTADLRRTVKGVLTAWDAECDAESEDEA